MVPVGTPRERLAVGERLLDRLRVGRGAAEHVPLLGGGVREVLELHEHRALGRAGLGNGKGERKSRLREVNVVRKKFSFIWSNACAGMRAFT